MGTMVAFFYIMATFAINKRAKSDYQILETFEAGIKLTGAEVKSVRLGGMRLTGAYVTLAGGNVSLINAHIAAYKPAGPQPDYDPTQSRRLLLKKEEVRRLSGLMQQKGYTLVPLRSYSLRNFIKLEFAVGRGKRQFEKREDIKRREAKREMGRAMRRPG
jgi:SsrA-binding protein